MLRILRAKGKQPTRRITYLRPNCTIGASVPIWGFLDSFSLTWSERQVVPQRVEARQTIRFIDGMQVEHVERREIAFTLERRLADAATVSNPYRGPPPASYYLLLLASPVV
jgi:hypothetical protein